MSQQRTDLAIEICEEMTRNNSRLNGIECTRESRGGVAIDRIAITTPEGSRLFEKPVGNYVTLNVGRIWLDDRELFREKVSVFREVLREMLLQSGIQNETVLVAGLGNRSITADAIGPSAVKNLIVTRHLKDLRPLIFEKLGLYDTCAVTPGVLGETGIESADIIKSLVEKIRPGALIAIDALASRDLSRLVTTVQLCDSGIHPGAGIGNQRPGLVPEDLKIPILSVGVPTVVDAATLAADAVERFSQKKTDAEAIRAAWRDSGLNFFVTPKETDQIIREMGALIGYGINLALNESLSFEDMLSLIG